MKKWRVTQRRFSKYNLLGRRAGEFLDENSRDFRFKWVARVFMWFWTGDSLGGLIELRTTLDTTPDTGYTEGNNETTEV